jgi:hypothetical protein
MVTFLLIAAVAIWFFSADWHGSSALNRLFVAARSLNSDSAKRERYVVTRGPVEVKEFFGWSNDMKSRNLATNAQDMPTDIGSDVQEERGKNVPTLDEIRRRALEIHIERGGQGYDLDEHLDEWLQAERARREKYNKSNDEDAKKK